MPISQIKAGAILNYVILGLNAIVGIAYTPYMLRMLGQSEYGIYSLAASVIAYLSVLDLGFGNAVIRYTAKFRAEGKIKEQYSMFGMFTILYTVIGLITLVAGMVLYFNIDNLFGSTLSAEEIERTRIIVMLMVINLAVTFPLSIYGAIITAYEDFIFLRMVQIIRILFSTVAMILLLSYGYKAVAMVVVQTIFNIVVLGLNFFYSKNKIHIEIKFSNIDKSLLREVVIYSFWIFLNAIMDRIYWSTGQFVLGAISGTIAVAVYAVAVQLQGIYMMFSLGISGVFLPKVTGMVAKESSNKDISDLFIKTGRIQYIVLAYILSGFIVFGHQFIKFWAGSAYSNSYYISLLFFIPLTVPLIQNLGITILQARNQMKFRSIVYIIISIASLGLQIPLAKYYGGIGCGVAIATALILGQIIIMNIYYQRIQDIDIKQFWIEILKMTIVPAIICGLAFLGLNAYEIDTIPKLIWGMIIFSIVYLPLFWSFSMNKYEKGLIKEPLSRIIYKFSR